MTFGKIRILCCSVAVCSAILTAGSSHCQDNSLFWKRLETRIERLTLRKHPELELETVKGRRDPCGEDLYWKGEIDRTPVSDEELEIVRTALKLAREGNRKLAEFFLEQFIEGYPNSILAGDARKAIGILQAESSNGQDGR